MTPDISTLPAGMRNNNPGNLKYFRGAERKFAGVTGPSVNTDEGTPQMVFKDVQSGMAAAAKLALQKYSGGRSTIRQIIMDPVSGWTPNNLAAGMHISEGMGVGLDDPVNLRDPGTMRKFMRSLIAQEHGPSGRLYSDAQLDEGINTALGMVGAQSANYRPPMMGGSGFSREGMPGLINPQYMQAAPPAPAPATPEYKNFPDMSVAGGREANVPARYVPPGFIRYNISDGTVMEGMDPRTLAALQEMAYRLQQAGGTGLEVRAGKGFGGHKSHYTGTEMDVVGYGPGGAVWSPELRLAAAGGAREAGANRFGLYSSGNTLHFGFGATPMTWGQGGLTDTPASRAFTNPNELAFSQAVLAGQQYALPTGATSSARLPNSYAPNPAMQFPTPRPMGMGMGPMGRDSFSSADFAPVSVTTGQPVAAPAAPAGGAGNGIDWSGMAGAFGGGTGTTAGVGGGGGDGSGMSLTPQDSPAPSAQAQQGPPMPPGMTALLPKVNYDFGFDPNTIGSFSRLMAARSQNPYRA